jgi:adenylate cyclase
MRLTFQTRRSRLYRAAAHAALGEADRAQAVVAEAVANSSDLTTDYLDSHEFYKDQAIKTKLIELLVHAGLPECQPRIAAV